MGRRNRRVKTYPGSIYKPKNINKWVIKFQGKTYSTGLDATKEGYELAEMMLKRLYLESRGFDVVRENILPAPSFRPKKPVDGVTYVKAWEEFKTIGCANLMPKTIKGYADSLGKIIPDYTVFYSNEHSEECVVKFVSNTHLSNASVNVHLRAFQVFVNFVNSRYNLPARNFYKEFKKPTSRKPVAVYSPAEIQSLLYYAEEKDAEFALLIRFLLATGFRIGQALTLEWSHVEDNAIWRLSKHRERIEPFPITNEVQAILAAIPRRAGQSKVFRWSNNSRSSLLRDLNVLLDRAGIAKNNRGWHVFRKTAGTRWAEAGLPLQEVKKLLGHTDIAVTNQYYVSVDLKKVTEKLNQIH